jgi:peptide deformylase
MLEFSLLGDIQPRRQLLSRNPSPRVGSRREIACPKPTPQPEQVEAGLSFPVMAVVPIRIVGDPVLHKPTEPVPVGADGSLPADLADLITNLYDTMDAAFGVGLAANQIGVSSRVFVYDCADERGQSARRRGVVVNPVLETSEVPETMPDPDDDDEGCLSVPGESFPTGRAEWARVTGLDADGTPVTLEGAGLFARMLQHETGHLDGLLYLDRLVGRHARAAKRAVKSRGWGEPGLSWTPGEVPDPFGH